MQVWKITNDKTWLSSRQRVSISMREYVKGIFNVSKQCLIQVYITRYKYTHIVLEWYNSRL